MPFSGGAGTEAQMARLGLEASESCARRTGNSKHGSYTICMHGHTC